MKRSVRSWAASIGIILMAAGVVALVSGSPARAAENPNTLTFNPATGTDVIVPKVHTAGPCPELADGYVANITGPGLFHDPFLITEPQDVNLSHTAGFDVQLGNSLLDATRDLGGTAVEPGYYKVTVTCWDSFTFQVYQTFEGYWHFTDAHTYQTGPKVYPGSPDEPSPSTSASTSPTATTSPTTSPTDTTEPTTDPTDTTEPTTDPTDTTTPEPTATTSPASTLPVTGPPAGGLFGLGIVLIILGGCVVLGTMRFDRPQPARW